jgi:hypothetical protein
VSELTFDDYGYHARTTAYFLDEPDPEKRLDTVVFGCREELNELLTDPNSPSELRELYWGREIDPDTQQQLQADKTSEAGDVLFYIAAAGMLRKTPLRQVAAKAIELYSGESSRAVNHTIAELDNAVRQNMPARVGESYRPEYVAMQMFGVSPFQEDLSPPGSFDELGIVAQGPLFLHSDGLYALERLGRNFGDSIASNLASGETYVHEAALLLGGLSATLQNRLGSSLVEAAHMNIDKRERRAAANTLAAGQDPERSRPAGKARPRLSGPESTQLALLGIPADMEPIQSTSSLE